MATAIDPGVRPPRLEDALAVFTVSAPTEDWDIPVLAVADSHGGRARGGLATTAATDTLTDALSGRMLRLDLTTRGWQTSVAEAVDGAFSAASRRVAELAREGEGPANAALTTALIVGDWLAVAHVGSARVYRLGRGVLEQLTLDGARGRLGEPAAEQPSVRFVRVRSGDVILVCTDGVHRYLDGEELAGHLGAKRALGDIAGTLVSLAKSRGGEDNIALCLARIGRLPSPGLPEPEPLPLRLTDEVGSKLLPRYSAPGPRRWSRRALRIGAGVAAALALAAVGLRGWELVSSRVDFDRIGAAVGELDSVARETLATRGSGEVAQPPEVPAEAPAIAPPPPAPEPLPGVVTRVLEPSGEEPPGRSVADSIAAARREAARLAPIREKARRDSIARAREAESQRVSDSLAAAQLAALEAAEAQRVRDSVADVERRAREEAAERERAAADRRMREETARAEEARRQREREERLSRGRQALQDWLWALTNAVKSGDGNAAVLRAGPPRFAEFVTKSRPEVGEARLSQMSVTEATGTANAEFTLRWRTEFGTSTTRRVRASASIAPSGDGWRLRGWQILDGAP